MTGRYLALIRGINNIGTTKRVAMADLRAVFEGLGFREVRTLLNSGNVVFSLPGKQRGDPLARIEKALASRLKLAASVTLLAADEVATVVRDNPLSRVTTNPSHLLVVVPLAPSGLEERLKPLLKEQWAPEALALGRRVAYLWCANGLAKSPLRIAVERALGRSGTGRNMATLTKVLAVLEEPPS